jgi:hypothetical protein
MTALPSWRRDQLAMYVSMTDGDYWKMLESEDPDDRAIREAHGIGYFEDYMDLSVVCRHGCGATYMNISSGKIRKCWADE